MTTPWKTGIHYSVGDTVTYNSHAYLCLNSHTSQVDWYPCIDTLSIWKPSTTNSIPLLTGESYILNDHIQFPTVPILVPEIIVPVQKNGTILAPYLYTWGLGNSAYKINCCMDIVNKLKGNAVTIAFVLGDTSTKQMSTDILAFSNDISIFTKSGGQLIISFGGAAGSYLEDVVSENVMVTQVSNLLDTTGCRAIDFDIEGSYLANSTLNDKRAKVIARLQLQYPGLYISLTLPADTNGITNDGKNCILNCISNGVNISVVNSMAMDLGALPAGQSWGVTACKIGDTVVNQLRTIYTKKTTAQLYKMIGLTVMIGKNDDGTIFMPSDAIILGNYAKLNNIGLVSFWSINRDQVGLGDLGVFSQSNNKDFEYYTNIKNALNMVVPTTPTIPIWQNGNIYKAGDIITFMGSNYKYISTHTATLLLTPNITPSLWNRV